MVMHIPKAPIKNPNAKLPAWLTDHFTQSLDAHKQLFQIVDLSERGIGVLRGIPKVVKVLAKVNEETEEPSSLARIEAAEKEAALAQAEIAEDFPVLHGFAVVALWSWTEHFIKGFVTLWLLHRRDSFSTPAVQRLKVKVGDYAQMQKREQAAFLVELLEQDLASSLKRGANRFESLLEPFGLSGSLSDECSKTIFELQQVRNVIAHRNGKADRRLRSECPWLKLKINQPVKISRDMLQAYSNAVAEYLLTILYRTGDLYGQDLRT